MTTNVPTTKVMAIGRLTGNAQGDTVAAQMPLEVRDTVRLYLAGKIDQWYAQTNNPGVVFILNVADEVEAHSLLSRLPLGEHGLMEFQLIPLGPLSPLAMLL